MRSSALVSHACSAAQTGRGVAAASHLSTAAHSRWPADKASNTRCRRCKHNAQDMHSIERAHLSRHCQCKGATVVTPSCLQHRLVGSGGVACRLRCWLRRGCGCGGGQQALQSGGQQQKQALGCGGRMRGLLAPPWPTLQDKQACWWRHYTAPTSELLLLLLLATVLRCAGWKPHACLQPCNIQGATRWCGWANHCSAATIRFTKSPHSGTATCFAPEAAEGLGQQCALRMHCCRWARR